MYRKNTFLLFFLSAIFLHAAPHSFLIPPDINISGGSIIRVYNLEYGKDALNPININELQEIMGNSGVYYTGGKFLQINFGELVKSGAVSLTLCNNEKSSFTDFIKVAINDKSIVNIKTGNEGIYFLRKIRTDHEDKIINNNISSVIALEKQGFTHSAIQEYINRSRIFNVGRTPQKLVIDFQTTEKESGKITSSFTNSAAVSFRQNNQTFLRIDGLLNKTVELNPAITELLTHYHSDHINQAIAEQCLREEKYHRFIAPYPLLEASKTKTFRLLARFAGIKDEPENPASVILDIMPRDKPQENTIAETGDFIYSSFTTGKDIVIEMYRYRTARDINSDCLFYRITHKNVSYLLFGDFDDPEGINKILEISGENEINKIEIMEEISGLTLMLFQAQAVNNTRAASQLLDKIEALNSKLSGLVILKADIIKWPHHAHKFPNNETSNNIIKKLNDITAPCFIIWQRHYTQNGFTEYIKRFDFERKFLCSDDFEIEMVSMGLKTKVIDKTVIKTGIAGQICNNCFFNNCT